MDVNSKKSSTHVYEYVIIGSGFSGLLVSSALSKATENILLLESADTFGGLNRRQETATGLSNNGFRFLPDSELARKSLEFLFFHLGKEPVFESVENAPVTYEAGKLAPFKGFGRQEPVFHEEIAYFLSENRLLVELPTYEWVEKLFASAKGDFLPRSYVTKIVEEGGLATGVLINGQRMIRGRKFIFCGPVRDLSALLPHPASFTRFSQRSSKSKKSMALCLDIIHEVGQQELEGDETKSLCPLVGRLHILNIPTSGEIVPCIGQIFPLLSHGDGLGGLQLSQWVSFVDRDYADEEEQLASALKKMKRQIKKVYPAILNNQKSERIVVAPSMGETREFKLNVDQSLPHLPNFWVGSGTINSQRNLLGTLQQVELVCRALEGAYAKPSLGEGPLTRTSQKNLDIDGLTC